MNGAEHLLGCFLDAVWVCEQGLVLRVSVCAKPSFWKCNVCAWSFALVPRDPCEHPACAGCGRGMHWHRNRWETGGVQTKATCMSSHPCNVKLGNVGMAAQREYLGPENTLWLCLCRDYSFGNRFLKLFQLPSVVRAGSGGAPACTNSSHCIFLGPCEEVSLGWKLRIQETTLSWGCLARGRESSRDILEPLPVPKAVLRWTNSFQRQFCSLCHMSLTHVTWHFGRFFSVPLLFFGVPEVPWTESLISASFILLMFKFRHFFASFILPSAVSLHTFFTLLWSFRFIGFFCGGFFF